MAAPSGTTWGSIVGGYGRIGVYHTTDYSDPTKAVVSVQVWIWTKYSVSDSSNALYASINSSTSDTIDQVASNISITTSVASGTGWSTQNQKKIRDLSFNVTRNTDSDITRYICVKLTGVDRVGGTMSVYKEITVKRKPTYSVHYNANGGSNPPSMQTKKYGVTLALSSTKPTRTGYTFKGWGTSTSDTTVDYAAGANYTANAAITLYAIWQIITYTVTYNANGGSGAPASQSKDYGETLTIPTKKPTRTNYNFLGWGTSTSDTTVDYATGGKYSANANATLYAIWEVAYVKPRIFNIFAECVDFDDYIVNIKYDWESDRTPVTCRLEFWVQDTVGQGQSADYHEETSSNTSGQVSYSTAQGNLDPEVTYTVEITVTDSGGSTVTTTTVSSLPYTIDYLAGGKGIAFGKAAEKEGVAEFDFDAEFNKPVYGNALGMNKLPEIPANSDLNNYMETGCYAVYSNANAETIANVPVLRAGRLEVWSSTGEGIRSEQWSYLRQRYIPYNDANAVWERDITRSSDNVWRYYTWYRSTLTPAASRKIYVPASMTIGITSNKTLGVVNTYTKIPFDKNIICTDGTRLTLSENSIRIGANISHIKVSGQTLVQCKSAAGNRFAKIFKTSGSTTTYGPWIVSTGALNDNMVLPLTPMIMAVNEGDLIGMQFYTSNAADVNCSGSAANGYQTYLTVEEL